jgi:hypothetical protein
MAVFALLELTADVLRKRKSVIGRGDLELSGDL